MFTIEDLTKYKCNVINDGTLQQFKKIIKAAFPNTLFKDDYEFGYTDEQLMSYGGFTQMSELRGIGQPITKIGIELQRHKSQSVIDFYN